MDAVARIISLLRESEKTRWVADQLVATFAQGVSMSVKEARGDARFFELQPPGLSTRELKKRETYETTRPYTEAEKLELLKEALKAIFVDLPAIELAGVQGLVELGASAKHAEFIPADALQDDHPTYARDLDEINTRKSLYAEKLKSFLDRLET